MPQKFPYPPLKTLLTEAVQSTRFFHFGTHLEVPFRAFTNISLLSLPERLAGHLFHEAKRIRRRDRGRSKRCSVVDCQLALLGKAYNLGVVSYDRDVFSYLADCLEMDAFWPFDIVEMKERGIFLIDTNIMVYAFDHDPQRFEMVMKFFRQQGIRVVIPDFIFAEYERKLAKRQQTFRAKLANLLRPHHKKYKSKHRHRTHV